MHRLSPLLLCLILAACGRQDSGGPFTDSRIPPTLAERFLPPEGWAWGLIQIGDEPPIRYGVAAPPVEPRGDVLILAGYGESAEDWFEPVSALVTQGYAVWVMDGAGQGGSGRYARPRDLGHTPDFAPEAVAVRAMRAVIGRPVVVVAQSTAAPTALTALTAGLPARGLVLSAPVFSAADPSIAAGSAVSAAAGVRQVRLGWLRAVGQSPWRRTDPLPRGRAGVIAAWQAANPDLRMGGVTYGWIDAFDRQSEALVPARLARIGTKVMVLTPQGAAAPRVRTVCRALPACTVQPVPGGRAALHLEGDGPYDAWIGAVTGLLKTAFPPR